MELPTSVYIEGCLPPAHLAGGHTHGFERRRRKPAGDGDDPRARLAEFKPVGEPLHESVIEARATMAYDDVGIAQIRFEDCFDDGAALAAANHFSRGFRSGKQAERIDDNGFSGARFTGEQIEALFKVQLELIDKGKIANAQELQHTSAL